MKSKLILFGIAIMIVLLSGLVLKEEEDTPVDFLETYVTYIETQNYESMYHMTSQAREKESFIQRNLAIYEGIEAENFVLELLHYDEQQMCVTYALTFDTVAGEISSIYKAYFQEGENGYEILWDDSLIFPELSADDKVRVSTTEAKRGQILDRNGKVLAGKGTASLVGIVPGKLEDETASIVKIAELLEVDEETVVKKLEASWVKEDSFVPIKTISKVKEIDLMAVEPDEAVLKEQTRQEELLAIPGVMISDKEVREYPLGKAASHLIGYVQNVTAEDLEEHAGEGYTANSLIGRNGMEGLYERKLKGNNGCRIYIEDKHGVEKTELACILVQHGEDIQLTIDADLQKQLFEQFKEDKSCSVAMDPYAGEVLALVSTPAYDNNDFIMGLSTAQWTALNEDKSQPMYNRFRQNWCPGSTFKPITAVIGLETGAIDSAKDYGNEGFRWQKDVSWGSYYVTTLHEYEPATLENALIYSDNIYFAKAALEIGAEQLEDSLDKLGFYKKLPFEITMSQSQYSNTEAIENEIMLADSGYGQGQVLVNPLHLACLYSGFLNQGNVIKPYLEYQEEANGEFWLANAFSAKTADTIVESMKKVVNDPNGTGYSAHREDVMLAGKTGTAEIKVSQEDEDGTELGWFSVFTTDDTVEQPLILISMVEDVKERGGSSYVVEKSAAVLDSYLVSQPQEVQNMDESAMGMIRDIYAGVEKEDVYDTALDEATILKMQEKLAQSGRAVSTLLPYSNMKNYEVMDAFLKQCQKGEEGSIVTYGIRSDGGITTREYIFDGTDLYVSNVNEIWNTKMEPTVIHDSYTKVKQWKYTEKGWFCYIVNVPNEQNLSEIADTSILIRVKPLTEEQRRLSQLCVQNIGYQGNNLLRSNWDWEHLETLDYNGLYQCFYQMEYQKTFSASLYEDGIPKDEFETLMMEFLPVTAEQIRKFSAYDAKKQTYLWQQVYAPTYFDTSFPEVIDVRKNEDETITLTVDAICDMVVCDDAVITSELTILFDEDGSFRYLGNQVIEDGLEKIPEYQYRVDKEECKESDKDGFFNRN